MEQDLFTDLEDMDWSEVTLAEGDDLIDAVHACDFHDIAESSFHGDQSLLETLTHVLNSNEDVAFDSSCRVNVGAIRYPRGGKGHKMSTLALKISKKRSIVAICNDDNICLVRATLVALAGACKLHPDEFRKFQMRQPTFTTGEMLIHFWGVSNLVL